MPESTIKTYAWNSPEMKELIKESLRRAFKRSPVFKQVMNSARKELSPLLNKNGSPSKKKNVKYQCNSCKGLFPQKWVQVDHIKPVVPLHTDTNSMSIEDLAKGIICDESNLQVLCSVPLEFNNNIPSCHRYKCNIEKFARTYVKEKWPNTEVTDSMMDLIVLEYKNYLIEKELKKINKKKRKMK